MIICPDTEIIRLAGGASALVTFAKDHDSAADLRLLRDAEANNKARKTVLAAYTARIEKLDPTPADRGEPADPDAPDLYSCTTCNNVTRQDLSKLPPGDIPVCGGCGRLSWTSTNPDPKTVLLLITEEEEKAQAEVQPPPISDAEYTMMLAEGWEKTTCGWTLGTKALREVNRPTLTAQAPDLSLKADAAHRKLAALAALLSLGWPETDPRTLADAKALAKEQLARIESLNPRDAKSIGALALVALARVVLAILDEPLATEVA